MFGLFHSKTRTQQHKAHKARRKEEEQKEKERGYEAARNQQQMAINNAGTANSATTPNTNDYVGLTEDGHPYTVEVGEDGQSWCVPYTHYSNRM